LPKVDVQLDIGENHFEPMRFVETVKYADDLGFRTAWLGDHIYPWWHSAGGAPFIWSYLATAMEHSDKIKIGPLVTVPIGARYHPAIIAQASATIDNMFPGRLLLGVGSGEALNERPMWNGKWPKWEERMGRLVEGVKLIRQMWTARKPFAFKGKYFSADFYYLYTKPKADIPIYFSGVGPKAAYFAGLCADTLVTMCPRNDVVRLGGTIIPAYEKGLKDAGKKKGRLHVHSGFSFLSPSELKRKEWRSLGILNKDSWSIKDPVEVENAGTRVTLEEMKSRMFFCKDWSDLVRQLQPYVDEGADEICLSTGADWKLIKEVRDNVFSVF
jgi:G6PDH family F420-dependent oxidoreductase